MSTSDQIDQIEQMRTTVAAYDAEQREQGYAALRQLVASEGWAAVRNGLVGLRGNFAQVAPMALALKSIPDALDRIVAAIPAPADVDR